MRMAVAGNILSLPKPRSAWTENFLPLKAEALTPILPARATLSELGYAPSKKAVVVSMSIDGSYATAYGKGPVGWEATDLTAVKLAAGVLNAMESYFWVG